MRSCGSLGHLGRAVLLCAGIIMVPLCAVYLMHAERLSMSSEFEIFGQKHWVHDWTMVVLPV